MPVAAFAAFSKHEPRGKIGERTDSRFETATRRALHTAATSAVEQGYNVSITCPSNNCTWTEPYETLAVCSTCQNLSASLEGDPGSPGTQYNYTLPNGVFLWGDYDDYDSEDIITTFNMTTSYATTYTVDGDLDDNSQAFETIAFQGFGGVLANVFVISKQPRDPTKYDDKIQAASECILQLCAKRFTATMVDQVLLEEEIPGTSWTNSSEEAVSPLSTSSHDSLPFAQAIDLRPDSNRLYHAAGKDALLVQRYLKAQSHGSTWPIPSTGESDIMINVKDVLRRRSGSIDLIMGNIARSLSQTMRVLSTGNNLCASGISAVASIDDLMPDGELLPCNRYTATGQVWSFESVVRVDWAWLTLPEIVILLTLILVLAAKWAGKSDAADVWKNNSLAGMFHGYLSPSPATGVEHIQGMQEAAQTLLVKLEKDTGKRKHLVRHQEMLKTLR